MSKHKSRNNLRQETQLTKREIKILYMRYDDSMILRDIGDVFSVTGPRAKQIIDNALIKIGLERYLYNRGLLDCDDDR